MSLSSVLTLPITGKGAVQMNGVDQLVLDFLKSTTPPDATVAVSKQGRLVWSKKGLWLCEYTRETPDATMASQ
jgi:hypothetical protein